MFNRDAISRKGDACEWLEADGLGGFSSGTVSGIRTRRYHALLLAAVQPPSDRMVLVNGLECWVETPEGPRALSSQRYAPDVVHPDGYTRFETFDSEPWPQWRCAVAPGVWIEHELFVRPGASAVFLSWNLVCKNGSASGPYRLRVRPLLSGRDFHALHHENPAFDFAPHVSGDSVRWKPYAAVPAVFARSNAAYTHAPEWYRNFCYTQERERGLDCLEDLGSPGILEWDLNAGSALWILGAQGLAPGLEDSGHSVESFFSKARQEELRRREGFASHLHRAASSYVVARGFGKTLIAGYPWFGDWGRDTFIAMRGLCLVTGRLQEARSILEEWAELVSEGMLPNRFPDRGGPPEYNSVDASLWFIMTADEFLESFKGLRSTEAQASCREKLHAAVESILQSYLAGTRFGIRAEPDGLLACGLPGTQLTWMDARLAGRPVTPRVGKPVEVQALWLNALAAASRFSPRWKPIFERGLASFEKRFWNESTDYPYDVVDCDHVPGAVDAAVRPNALLAAGGLPVVLFSQSRARAIVDRAEKSLWTPLGLRSLAPGEPGYAPRYEGNLESRDHAYHQGTVWPWLLGPFVEAWMRVRGNSAEARAQARERFVQPLMAHLQEAGLGHVSEIADAEPPHAPRGCPFQAWSLGELLRLTQKVLAA